jgi:predicted nucleotidyltransferase
MGRSRVLKLEDIISRIKIHKSEIMNEFSIKEIGIFGSYLREEANGDSDIDILVDFEKPVDLFRFLDLEEKLSELTGGKVDLVSRKALKPEIGKRILQEVRYL